MKQYLVVSALLIAISLHLNAQSYILLAREMNDHWKYYNLKGEVLIDKKYPAYYKFNEDGFALVGKDDFTILNRRGEEVKTEIVVRIYDDHHYIAAFYSDGLLVTHGGRGFGCLDTLGHVVARNEYKQLSEFHDGHALGIMKGKAYVVDKTGNKVSIADTTIVKGKAFHESLAAILTKDDKWGFVDTHGNIAITPQFDRVGNFWNGLAWARNGLGLVGFINKEGNWIIEPKFDAANNFDPESGLARIKCVSCANGRIWNYINTKGEIQEFKQLTTRGIDEFSEGLATSQLDGLVGYINNTGEWVIKPQFENARDFENDHAWVKKGLWGLIDKQGNWVIEPKFEAVKNITRLK